MPSLDEVLSDKPIEKPEAPKAEAPAEPAAGARAEPEPEKAADGQPTRHNTRREHQKKEWEAQGRDPATGQFVAKDPAKAEAPKEPEKKAEAPAPKPEAAKPAAAPAQEMTEKERAAFAAAADERRKRQALEQELAQLRAAQPQPVKPQEPAKKFWDDPDGALASEEQRRQADRVMTKLQTAEMIARSRYPDFDEKMAVFKQLVTQNPALVPSWINHPDPGAYAYQMATNHQQLQQVGGMDAMRKKIEEETAARVRAEVEAEHKKKLEELERQRAALPPTLSDVRGASTGKAPAWGGPRPLGDVLTGKP